ncbi:MAG TPA: PEP-CTERM sorting domain-containing protein [Vicinamibacterales bacterium]|nr:PEP-CTERM sorting domain-containing protein [Vicinamibacterales bacterium]
MSNGRLVRWGSAIAIGAFGFFGTASQAHATSIEIQDPLHGFCGASASSSTCSDNGTITPFSSLGSFGFYASPDDLNGTNWLVAILVPTNVAGAGSESFTVSETAGAGNTAKASVAANLLAGTWTSGDLADFLASGFAIDASNSTPANPFNAFTVMNNSAVTGFYVYVADLGAAELFKQSGSSAPDAPLLTLGGSAISSGMEITSFLLNAHPGDNQPNVATAPSGVLLANGDCCTVTITDAAVPEPASLLLLGTGVAVIARRVRRRSR